MSIEEVPQPKAVRLKNLKNSGNFVPQQHAHTPLGHKMYSITTKGYQHQKSILENPSILFYDVAIKYWGYCQQKIC